MGFSLSGIVSDITSLATDPGKAAKDICDAVLPQNLKAVGDVVGGALDVETGNPLQALGHMADALKDLPQMAQGLPGTTAGKAPSTPAGTAAAEPSPPPTRAPSLQQVIAELTALAGGGATTAAQPACTAAPPATATPTASTTAVGTTACAAPPATTATPAAAPPTTGAPAPANAAGSSQVTISVSSNGRTVSVSERYTTTTPAEPGRTAARRSGWNPTPASATTTVNTVAPAAAASPPTATVASGGATAASAAPASASSTGSPTSTAAPATTAAGTAAAASAASPTGTATAATAAAPSSLSSLMSMSNDQFMQAVTSGNIPADVANNPSAMAEIQARMNQITQMNQLVTSMMAAMHQMQMAIIQNIRV